MIAAERNKNNAGLAESGAAWQKPPMSSRKNSLAAMERQIKRRLGKYRLDLLKAQKPDAKVLAHGGYKLRESDTGKILFGEKGYEFSADLDDIEAWLDEQEAQFD